MRTFHGIHYSASFQLIGATRYILGSMRLAPFWKEGHHPPGCPSAWQGFFQTFHFTEFPLPASLRAPHTSAAFTQESLKGFCRFIECESEI
jgi:hypothetical protein